MGPSSISMAHLGEMFQMGLHILFTANNNMMESFIITIQMDQSLKKSSAQGILHRIRQNICVQMDQHLSIQNIRRI